MTSSLHCSVTLGLAALLLCYGGCSVGTNTGNGGNPGSSGGGGSTGGTSGFCPYQPCLEPDTVVDGDGEHYRGSMDPNATLAAWLNATSIPNPPEIALELGGNLVEESDAGCTDLWPDPSFPNSLQYGPRMAIVMYLCAADSSIDDTGALRVHGAPFDGEHASFALVNDEGAQIVDLRITTDAHVTATLSVANSPADPRGMDAGADTYVVTVDGPLRSGESYGVDGGWVPANMHVSDGSIYVFPYWTPRGCGGF